MSKITNKADLGKVAITVSSAPWNANTKYEKLTQVFLDGDSYVSLKDNKNVNPSTDTTGTWAKSTAHGKSLYELLNEKGLYDGTEEEFLAEWNKRAEDVDKDLKNFDDLNKEFKKTETIVKNTVDNANTAIHEAGEATNLAISAASNAEAATTRANAAAANAEGIKTSLDNFIAQGGGATDAQVIKNTEDIATLGLNISELGQQVIYDVSTHNGGVGFDSLSTLLSSPNLSTLIPTSVRHGGMSIRFVQSSDNRYVQYRLMSGSFNTTVANWQGVDDEPTAGSNNLVKSGGVYEQIDELKVKEKEYPNIELKKTDYFVNITGTRGNYAGTGIFGVVPVKKGQKCIATISGANGGMSPLAFGASQSTNSDLLCTQLVQYHTGDNVYVAVVEDDGYCFISSLNTDTPTLEIITYLEMEEFIKMQQDVTVLKEDVENIKGMPTITEEVPVSLGKDGYYVTKNGTRGDYSIFCIFTPIEVKSGDRVHVELDAYNSACAPLSFNTDGNTDSDMQATPLVIYSDANVYDVIIENDGFLILSGDKTKTPRVTISKDYDFSQIEKNKEAIATETVRAIDAETAINTRMELLEEEVAKSSKEEEVFTESSKPDYFINRSGNRDNYINYTLWGWLEVKKGDEFSISLQSSNAVMPIAFNTIKSLDSDLQGCTLVAEFREDGVYNILIEQDGYIYLSALSGTTPVIKKVVSKYDILEKEIAEIKKEWFETAIPLYIAKDGYYVTKNGTRGDYSIWAIYSAIHVKAGDEIIVSNYSNLNSAVCPIAWSATKNVNSDMSCTPLVVYEANKTEYSAKIENDGFVYISSSKSITPIAKINRHISLVDVLSRNNVLYNKSIMLFGDSLTAGSTKGLIAFGEIIANNLGIEYRPMLYDRFESNPSDVNPDDFDVTYPCVTNYAKDGTKNEKVSGRTNPDSILERVKNHVKVDTNVDYVLVECSINDYTSGIKGEVVESYTADFNQYTALGAIEETCRYLTTLGKNIKVGFFIPWHISYVPEAYFDAYIALFKKWSIPLYDMRDCAGFNMRRCVAHQNLYSLSSSAYNVYSSTTTYNLDAKVKYEGKLYKCKVDNVVGIVPTNTEYWDKVSDTEYDGCHLNNLGHQVVAGKIQKFIESL